LVLVAEALPTRHDRADFLGVGGRRLPKSAPSVPVFRRSDSARQAGRGRLGRKAPSSLCGHPAELDAPQLALLGQPVDGESCIRAAGRVCGTRTCVGSGSRLSPGLSPPGFVSRPSGRPRRRRLASARLRLRWSLASDPERVPPSKSNQGGRETSWILVPVDEELPTRAAEPRFFGVGVGSEPEMGPIDSGNVEALRSIQPRGRGDQRSRRPGSKQLIHHQVFEPARVRYNAYLPAIALPLRDP